MSRLTIITINLNDVQGIEKTLKSVWECQSFTDFEHIVIDGGSTDGSVDVIKRYSDKLSYWVSEKDNGIYHAMNKGIDKAQGEYLLFLNSGDYLRDDVLKDIFSESYTEDVIYGYISELKQDGRFVNIKNGNTNIVETIFVYSLPHPATFIRRNLFDTEKYREDYKIISDWIFFLEQLLIKQRSFRYIDVNVSVFNSYGISSHEGSIDIIKKERSKFLKERFGDASDIIIKLAQIAEEKVNIENILAKKERRSFKNRIRSLLR